MMTENAQHLQDVVGSLQGLPYDERVTEGTELIEALRQAISAVAGVRAASIRELRKDYTLKELASMYGLSAQRISQMEDR